MSHLPQKGARAYAIPGGHALGYGGYATTKRRSSLRACAMPSGHALESTRLRYAECPCPRVNAPALCRVSMPSSLRYAGGPCPRLWRARARLYQTP